MRTIEAIGIAARLIWTGMQADWWNCATWCLVRYGKLRHGREWFETTQRQIAWKMANKSRAGR